MTYDYTITEEEFYNRDDLEPLECSEGNCSHYDALNQCCWITWWNKQEGDLCSYNWYIDGNGMIVKVLWKKVEDIGCTPVVRT